MEELITAGVEAELRTSYSTYKWGMFMLMHVFFYHQFSSTFDYWTICCKKKKSYYKFHTFKITDILISYLNQYKHDSYANMWVRSSGGAVHCWFLKCAEICVWIELRFLFKESLLENRA